jgi:hypothetical protein
MVLKWIQKNSMNLIFYLAVLIILFYLIGCKILGVCKGHESKQINEEENSIESYLKNTVYILLIIYIIYDIYRMSKK